MRYNIIGSYLLLFLLLLLHNITIRGFYGFGFLILTINFFPILKKYEVYTTIVSWWCTNALYNTLLVLTSTEGAEAAAAAAAAANSVN